jgi:hypothetical protein
LQPAWRSAAAHQRFEVAARLGVGKRQDEPGPPAAEFARVGIVEARDQAAFSAGCGYDEEVENLQGLAAALSVGCGIGGAQQVEGV